MAFVLALGLAALTACGGDFENTPATDLYSTYEVIEGGMSEAQVKAVIGVEPLRREPDGANAEVLTWEANHDTRRPATLQLTFKKDGVSHKIVSGYLGSRSQSY
ncbi:hypothetical protein [Hydrogenophaga sp. A37]|uniref:hypothetical protein n=1 Tax=Hydrogenophaga sp. A37 TaxID=1945864 RepID=UPI0015C55093|nr:hypothetical protein [Hydrogenophaga sp. A37]